MNKDRSDVQWLDNEAPAQQTWRSIICTAQTGHHWVCKFVRTKIEGDVDTSMEAIEDLVGMWKRGYIKVGRDFESVGVTFGGASVDSRVDNGGETDDCDPETHCAHEMD